jgi:hypothetical protein
LGLSRLLKGALQGAVALAVGGLAGGADAYRSDTDIYLAHAPH